MGTSKQSFRKCASLENDLGVLEELSKEKQKEMAKGVGNMG